MINQLRFMHAPDEALVRKTSPLTLALALVLAVLGTACPRHRGGSSDASPVVQTQTIAPAVAQPAPTGTDSMTQTVDVEDSRSEDDGGTITNSQTPATHGAKAPAKPKSAPVKKKKQ